MVRMVIFASGSGTNAENIIRYFNKHKLAEVTHVLTNNSKAGVLERAERLKVQTKVFDKREMNSPEFLSFLIRNADMIVLAGFLLKIPERIIESFPDSIVNIHPALLPKYGGKGMYGMNVHKAVVGNNEKESGITIHLVNENYDEGAILFQKTVDLDKEESPESLAEKIHELEYAWFPKIIEDVLSRKNEN